MRCISFSVVSSCFFFAYGPACQSGALPSELLEDFLELLYGVEGAVLEALLGRKLQSLEPGYLTLLDVILADARRQAAVEGRSRPGLHRRRWGFAQHDFVPR